MDAWQTYAFEFKGGLVSNLSPLQQGVQLPGSARELKNFEPSTNGGYRRIEGFLKYDEAVVPMLGHPLVNGGGQTGTTLVLADVSALPVDGDTFTIAGDATIYTVAVGGVSYNASTREATLTITPALAVSPADKAAVTFITQRGNIDGVCSWFHEVIAVRDGEIHESIGSGWNKINVPSYGTVLVNGGSQTGSLLVIDGLTAVPQIGDTFTIAGVAKVYAVTAVPTVTSGVATVAISPALASSPADNASITWLTTPFRNTGKVRFAKYRIGETEKLAGVAAGAFPFIYDDTTYSPITDVADVNGASHIAWFKNQMFFAKGDKLVFTAPYTDNDFSAANGAGVISVGGNITGLKVFREQLIVFMETRISRLVGNTLADFQLQPITMNIGCVAEDTIREIGGDVIFLGPDGLRLLSATDRIGDFNLAVVSKPIQKEMTDIISGSTSFSSIVINSKSQYRIFGYNENVTTDSAVGVLGTQMAGDDTGGMAWALTQGFKCYVADSEYHENGERIVFANSTGYVYQMENGNSFDGSPISAVFSTPFVTFGDPRIRKTFYKLFLYTDPVGSVSSTFNLALDFNDKSAVQPDSIDFGNNAGDVFFYGNSVAVYGTSTYGGELQKIFDTQLIGSGFSASLKFVSTGTSSSFSLDAATVEYSTHDRR